MILGQNVHTEKTSDEDNEGYFCSVILFYSVQVDSAVFAPGTK